MNTSSNPASCTMRQLATLFSATPPARHSAFIFVSRLHVRRHFHEDVFDDLLPAVRGLPVKIIELGLARPLRLTEQLFPLRRNRPLGRIRMREVVEIQAGCAPCRP